MTANQMTTVAYDKLTAPPEINARDADDYKDLSDLTSSIPAVGLLQPLVVRKTGALFEVLAGRRRFLAIGELIKAGQWPKSQPVPVMVRDDDDAAALEASLIENIARKPMHPVREYEVFAELHGSGSDVETIAKRYGVTAAIVRQRLALGQLVPRVREAWRDGRITAEAAQAFASIPDPRLPGALYLKVMREHFDAADFFSRATAKVALDAMAEMGTSGFDPKAKRAALASAAAEDAKLKGWLPQELRHPDYKLTGKRGRA